MVFRKPSNGVVFTYCDFNVALSVPDHSVAQCTDKDDELVTHLLHGEVTGQLANLVTLNMHMNV